MAVPDSTSNPTRASIPPSEPRPASRASFDALEGNGDRPARLQMIVALVLGLVLVAIPLYLWRRPRAESVATFVNGNSSSAARPAESAPPPPPPPLEEPKMTLAEARTIACQDPGPKKTAPERCDHLVEVEKALAKAIEEQVSCVPPEIGGGAIVYIADVSFKKKSVGVYTPKDGRSIKNAKVVAACQGAVKAKLTHMSLDGLAHQHARYKIAITATYRAPPLGNLGSPAPQGPGGR